MTFVKLMVAAALGKKPSASGTKMEQRSVTLLPKGKPRAVDNLVSCSEVDILRVVTLNKITKQKIW